MLRLVFFLLAVVALAAGLSWLADRPGLIVFNWEGYEGEISVFHAVVGLTLLVGLAIFSWSLLRSLWTSPAQMGRLLNRRRQKRGLDALSSGMIAIGAGDKDSATRYAIQARKSLPNEPLTHLLRAQAAQLSGDKGTSRRIFEAMLAAPDTEQLGLRGLFLEAEREGEREAAMQFAERALKLNPKLGWSVDALFDLQCKSADWDGALHTVSLARKHGHVDKALADRRRAVLLTAQAQAGEENDPERALSRALEAHSLAPGLVPAAAIAGRILAARGNTPKAVKVIQKTWLKSPHPDLAMAYAYARLGDSPRDRLDRVRQLAALTSNSIESPIAVARAAIEAKDFAAARDALEPLLEGRMTQRVATLMARIEGEQHGDKGRVREWLARAVNAPRDPVWTADGVISETWAPVSPVSGQLDAFQWRVPVESLEKTDAELLAQKLEELVTLGAPLEAIEGKPVDISDAVKTAEVVPAAKPEASPSKPAPKVEDKPGAVAAPAAAAAVPAAVSTAASPPTTAAPASPASQSSSPEAAAAPTIVTPVTPAATPASVQSVGPPSASPAQPAASPAAAIVPVAKPATSPSSIANTPPAREEAKVKPLEPVPAVGATTGPAQKTRGSETGAPAGEIVVVATAEPRSSSSERPAKVETSPNRTNVEAQIFVSPRAPDDPGPDAEHSEGHVEPMPRRSLANR